MTGSNVKFSQDGVTNNDQIHNKFTCHNLVNNLCQLRVTLSHHFSVTIKIGAKSEVLNLQETLFGL